jgi:putative membrane protein
MLRTLVTNSLLAALIAVPSIAWQTDTDQLSANDKDFIEFAGETDLTTVRIARMAQLYAASPKVQSFARMLEQEHSADLKKLTSIANQTGGVAPDTLDDVHMSAVRRLQKSKGKPFTHAFLKTIVNDHENVLISYKREADHGFDPKLQAYAKAALPRLEAHLRDAKELASALP